MKKTPAWHRLAAAALLALGLQAAPAACAPLEWRGISLSSAEWGEKNFPGVLGKDYAYPTVESTAYYQAKGMNLMRVAFRWERLQPTLNGDFDAAELGRLRQLVDGTTARGLSVLLDPHNYAAYRDKPVGSREVPIAAFADFWRRLSLQFKDNPRVLFGLVNEPHDLPTETWADAAQAVVDAIRATGAANVITLPGNGWTGAWSWHNNWYGTANAEVMTRVKDPADRMLIEVHQYFDDDGSGSHTTCVSPAIGAERLQRFTEWLRRHGRRGLLGELGGGDNPACAGAVRGALDHLQSNADVWAGWLWWAGGPLWGDYFMSLEPGADGRDKPQMRWLEPYLNHTGPTAFCTQLSSDPDGDGIGTEAGAPCKMRTGFDITADMGYGWNLGNTMDAMGNTADPVGDETQWGNPRTTQANLDAVHRAGFKTLRLPVSWDDHVTGTGYTIDTAWMDRVEAIANYALNDGMYVIVNVHHVGAWESPTTDNEASAADRLRKLWTQIATRFAKYDHHVIFETMNEPRNRSGGTDDWWGKDPSTFTVINHLNAAALAAIRATGGNNARRLVMMPGYVAGTEEHQLDAIVMPNDKMVALSAHSYSPYHFALNLGTGSVTTFTDTATVDAIFARLDSKFIQKGIPVVMGEWGALLKNNNDERVKHAMYFGQKGSAYKIPIVWWDNGQFTYDPDHPTANGEAYGLLDRVTNTWRFPQIVDAIKAGWGS